jgi:hypothetical protein
MGRSQTSKSLMAFTEATIERYTNRPSEDAWRIAVLANPASLFHLRQSQTVWKPQSRSSATCFRTVKPLAWSRRKYSAADKLA